MKNNQLMDFLTKHEGDEIWLLLPSGLLSGTVQTLPAEDVDTIVLDDAMQLSGDIAISIGPASIIVDKIIAWGNHIPVFIDKEEG